MPVSTDEMYNAESRYLHQLFKIHFSSSEVLEVTKSKYLISSSNLEESYKSSDSPFGDVTSNELTLTLYNENNIFNPINRASKYYGLIKKGVKIEAFIRPEEVDEWDPIGVFYVSDWYTASSGLTAEVTANDALYNVLNGPVPSMPIFRNARLTEFLPVYFSYFGYDVTVDPSLDTTIPYIYTSEHSNNKAFLTDLMKCCLADCFCDHNGNINVISKVKARAIRATLTDNDQIISVDIKQAISTSYDSVSVSYNKTQESNEQSILEVSEINLVPGLNSTGKLNFSKHPVLSVRSLKTTGSNIAKVQSFTATSKDFDGSIQSTYEGTTELKVIGTVLETVSSTIGKKADTPLKIESKFIQEESRAEAVSRYTEAYIEANMPTLELTIRGNPKIPIGSKLEVESDRYKVQYTGILIKAAYDYVGSLSCKITLADASVLEEV